MADQKISQLTDGGASQATDEYVIARSGANYRIDGASIAAAATSVGTLSSLTVSGDLTVDTNTLKVDSTNNRVGIGTATPSVVLDVIGTGGVMSLASSTANSTTKEAKIVVKHYNTAEEDFLAFYPYSTATLNDIYYGGGSSSQNAATGHYWLTAANNTTVTGTTRMSLDSSGNLAVDTNTLYVDAANNRVGVGTASPTYTLDVRGNIASIFSGPGYQAFISDGGGANNSYLSLYQAASAWILTANKNGSGTRKSISISTTGGDTTVADLILDTSGNLGLGVTPSAWTFTGVTALQIKNAGFWGYQNRANVTANGFVNNTGAYSYISNGFATTYEQDSGKHVWYTASSGTAGNAISFTTAMTLDASGVLTVGYGGTSSQDAVIDLDAGSASGGEAYMRLRRNSTTQLLLATDGSTIDVRGVANIPLTFWTNNTERARITANGEFLIGTTTATGPKLEVSGTARATGGINTNSGSASVANTTWTTLFTVPQTTAGKGIYSFMANYLDASDGQAFVELLVDRTYVRIASQSDGATLKLRLSGQNVQAYHNYGATVTISWGFLQIQIP